MSRVIIALKGDEIADGQERTLVNKDPDVYIGICFSCPGAVSLIAFLSSAF